MRRNLISFLILVLIILLINFLAKKQVIQEIFNTKKINKIIIINNNYISEELLFSKLNIKEGQSFWSFNPLSLKLKLDSIKEIESYKFRLGWNGTLKIRIEEKKPNMLWIFDNIKKYIDNEGNVLEFKIENSKQKIITLIGENANIKIKELTATLKNYKNIFSEIEQISLDKKLGWQIKLYDSNCIFLPLKKLDRLIDIFDDIYKSELYKKFDYFDFRVMGRVYMSNEKC